MAALLVSLSIMSLMMSMALPVWHQAARREREAELIFRGEQYARAIALWQRQRPGSAPADLDTLVEQRFLRKKYRDPMTEDGEFQLVLQSQVANGPGDGAPPAGPRGPATGRTAAGQTSGRGPGELVPPGRVGASDEAAPGGVAGGIVGVVSKSGETSIALYNGRSTYSEWTFVYTPDGPVTGGADPTGAGPGGGEAGRDGRPGGNSQSDRGLGPRGSSVPPAGLGGGRPLTPGR